MVIGEGYNAPPKDYPPCTTCLRESKKPARFGDFNTEPCPSIHGEQRAILDVLKNGYDDLSGTVMYHVRLKDGILKGTGSPSCTICSKLVLEAGISKFINCEKRGLVEYSAKEFNDLSFASIG